MAELPAGLEIRSSPPGVAPGSPGLDRRTGPGRSCWLVVDAEGAVVHSTWVSVGSSLLVELGLGDDAVMVGESATVPAHRGQGVYPAVLRAILRHHLATMPPGGDPHLYAMIDVGNEASQRSMARAGFASLGTIQGTTRLGRWHVDRSDVELGDGSEVSLRPTDRPG